MFNLYGPITIDGKVFTSTKQDEDDQNDKRNDYIDDLIDLIDDRDFTNLDTTPFNSGKLGKAIMAVFIGDLNYAAVCVVLVFLYMWFTLRSFWLTCNGLFNIVLSIPFTLVIYRGVLQISYYQLLHNLLIFVVLGVGADDIFVFTDAWAQSATMDGVKDC